jgi:hypothetical protein
VWVVLANGSAVWCKSTAKTVGYLLRSLAMTFRPATCVDGDPALGLWQWCCADVGSLAMWVVPMLGLRGFLEKIYIFNLNLV